MTANPDLERPHKASGLSKIAVQTGLNLGCPDGTVTPSGIPAVFMWWGKWRVLPAQVPVSCVLSIAHCGAFLKDKRDKMAKIETRYSEIPRAENEGRILVGEIMVYRDVANCRSVKEMFLPGAFSPLSHLT